MQNGLLEGFRVVPYVERVDEAEWLRVFRPSQTCLPQSDILHGCPYPGQAWGSLDSLTWLVKAPRLLVLLLAMATGAEFVVGFGLLASTITVFDACVKGFVLFSAATEMGSRGDVLRCRLQWEHFRLYDWGKAAGLLNETPEMKLAHPEIIHDTLANLEQLLTSSEKLRRDYGLSLTFTDEEIKHAAGVHPLDGRFGKSLERFQPQLLNDTAKIFARRNSAWKKIKWAAVDEKGLRLLLTDIEYFTTRLESLLHPADRAGYDRNRDKVMRGLICQSSEQNLLQFLEGPLNGVSSTIAAAARLKQKAVSLDLVEPLEQVELFPHSTNSASARPTTAKAAAGKRLLIEFAKLKFKDSQTAYETQVASFTGLPVVVEWKSLDPSVAQKLKYRVANVAAFLAEISDPAFHSLRCIGHSRVPESGHYVYVFQVPVPQPSLSVSMKSLDTLIQETAPPSLNTRLSIAIALAETLLHLHTADWLHKAISPANVLFFHPTEASWKQGAPFPTAYLAGYNYARNADPLQMSEEPEKYHLSDLHRHPSSVGSSRAPYCKSFDMFSLGCVLLELGFWQRLESIVHPHLNPILIHSHSHPPSGRIIGPNEIIPRDLLAEGTRILRNFGSSSIKQDLESKVGAAYGNIVDSCLTATSRADEVGGMEESLVTQQENLFRLQQISSVL